MLREDTIRGFVRIDLPSGRKLFFNNIEVLLKDENEIVFIDERKKKQQFSSDVIGYFKGGYNE